jgi:hypothetical protein
LDGGILSSCPAIPAAGHLLLLATNRMMLDGYTSKFDKMNTIIKIPPAQMRSALVKPNSANMECKTGISKKQAPYKSISFQMVIKIPGVCSNSANYREIRSVRQASLDKPGSSKRKNHREN